MLRVLQHVVMEQQDCSRCAFKQDLNVAGRNCKIWWCKEDLDSLETKSPDTIQ